MWTAIIVHIKSKQDPQKKDGETILSFFKNKRSFGFFPNERFADTVDFYYLFEVEALRAAG